MLLYIIKSALLLSALYIPYMLLLKKESFFRFNRLVLLAIMVLSLLLPLFDIHAWAWQSNPVNEHLQGIIEVGAPFALVTGNDTAPATEHFTSPPAINWWWIATVLYIVGMIATLLIKLVQMGQLYQIIRRGVLWTDKTDGVTIYCHTENIAPFSWMHSIVISEEDYTNNAAAILRHEMGHIRRLHSLDILLANICQVLQWANPFAWLLAGSLRDVHEYEADDTVLRSGINATQYQHLLIKKAVGSSSYAFANSFNHSLLKKRITMMLNKKSNPWMRTKALYLIPVGVVALSAFATPVFINHASPATDGEVANEGKGTTIPVNTEIAEAQNTKEVPQSATTAQVEEPVHYEAALSYSADEVSSTATLTEAEVVKAEPDDEIWEIVEELPVYKGGEGALMQQLATNLKYPAIAFEHGVHGRVLVQFVVEKDGTCSNFKVAETNSPSITSSVTVVKAPATNDPNASTEGSITQEQFEAAQKALEEEAIRVVKQTSGNWNPGKQRGREVRVRYTIPITYRLS